MATAGLLGRIHSSCAGMGTRAPAIRLSPVANVPLRFSSSSSSSSQPGLLISSGRGARHGTRPHQQVPKSAAAAADADAFVTAAEADAAQQQQQNAAGAAAYEAAVDEAAEYEAVAAAASMPKKKGSLAKRVTFGLILGLSGAAVIIVGGPLYGAVTCLAAYQLSQEYIGLVGAKGIAKGMPPPPQLVNNAISLLCVSLNAWVFLTNGRAASAMAVVTFLCLSLQLIAVRKPRFSQLSSSVFGLVYCGYLPSFWIKLRLMSFPAINSTSIAAAIPPLLGGPTHLTVGLIAAFVAVSCIIAADTGAYFCGKAFGRTQLTAVSPKKTVEGAVGGLLSSIGVALGLYKFAGWPDNSLSAAALGTIVFFASLFGDLIESVIKRDAGLKDASNLIPGHGGLLDRLDSYLFTGACVYFFIKFCLGNYGL